MCRYQLLSQSFVYYSFILTLTALFYFQMIDSSPVPTPGQSLHKTQVKSKTSHVIFDDSGTNNSHEIEYKPNNNNPENKLKITHGRGKSLDYLVPVHPAYQRTRKDFQETRYEYPEGHPDMIIFPSVEQLPPQVPPGSYSNTKFAYIDDNLPPPRSTHYQSQQQLYVDRVHFGDDGDSEPMNKIIRRYTINVDPNLIAVPQFENEQFPQEDNFYENGDTRYNSILFVGPRVSQCPCPKGQRRTHQGICRVVRPFRG